jgi:hypothetical protein
MGCDFYIYAYLEIQHINGISYYEFPTMCGYYCELDYGMRDSDDDENDYYDSIEYQKLCDNMKKYYLTPRKPIVIYDNNSFASPKFEIKYSPVIKDKINNKYSNKYPKHKDTGVFTSLEQVIKVIKKEERREPLIN